MIPARTQRRTGTGIVMLRELTGEHPGLTLQVSVQQVHVIIINAFPISAMAMPVSAIVNVIPGFVSVAPAGMIRTVGGGSIRINPNFHLKRISIC